MKNRNRLEDIEIEFKKLSDKNRALVLRRYFKTGKGEYGEGDIFLGISVPSQRELVRDKLVFLDFKELKNLLDSNIHEHRMSALLTLVEKYKRGEKEEVFNFYLKNIDRVNNWDLVDLSAPNILGDFLVERERKILYDLSKSSNLWRRRISVVSTYSFIKRGDFKDCLNISKLLLLDDEDLIKKAIGWMLREVGKRDRKTLEEFLKNNISKISSLTLRYAIEKFSKKEREKYYNLRKPPEVLTSG